MVRHNYLFILMSAAILAIAQPVQSAPLGLYRGTDIASKVAETRARRIEPRIIASREAIVFKGRALMRSEFSLRLKGKHFTARVGHRSSRLVDGERITTLRGALLRGVARQGRFTLSFTGKGSKPSAIFGELVARGAGLFALQTVSPGKTFLENHKQDSDTPGCGGPDGHPLIPPGAQVGHRNLNVEDGAPAVAHAQSSNVLTVLVAFSPQAASYLGSSMSASAQTAVDQLTQVFQNTGIDARAELVHTMSLSGAESGNFETDLNSITNFDGKWDDVHSARNQYGADMVALIIQNSQYCGLGWLGGYPGLSQASYSFSATSSYCIVQQTVSHEIGHNLGANHDRAYAPNGVFADGYGLIFRGNSGRFFGDVMTYAQYSNATRVPLFSGPAVFYDGVATGKLGTEDNKRVVLSILPVAMSNRGPAITPTATPTPGSYAVSGTYVNTKGEAVAGARVSLVNAQGDVVAVTTTSGSGTYSFSNVRGSQSYQIKIVAAGYDNPIVSVVPTSNTTVAAIQANLKTVTMGATVIDGLSMQPISGALIKLEGASTGSKSGTTNAQGKVAFDVPYGTSYRMSVTSDAFYFDIPTVTGVAKGSTERVFAAAP